MRDLFHQGRELPTGGRLRHGGSVADYRYGRGFAGGQPLPRQTLLTLSSLSSLRHPNARNPCLERVWAGDESFVTFFVTCLTVVTGFCRKGLLDPLPACCRQA